MCKLYVPGRAQSLGWHGVVALAPLELLAEVGPMCSVVAVVVTRGIAGQ